MSDIMHITALQLSAGVSTIDDPTTRVAVVNLSRASWDAMVERAVGEMVASGLPHYDVIAEAALRTALALPPEWEPSE